MSSQYRLRDLLPWPPTVWVCSGSPQTLGDPSKADLKNVRINDKGIHLEVLQDGSSISTTIPVGSVDDFKAVALVLLELKGFSMEEIGQHKVRCRLR